MEVTGQNQSSIDYWTDYYSKYRHTDPSPFAMFLVSRGYLDAESDVGDLCCGDGRDTNFFHPRCKSVVGVDQVFLENVNGFVCGSVRDFMEENESVDKTVYCRFGLPSVEEDVENEILGWSK